MPSVNANAIAIVFVDHIYPDPYVTQSARELTIREMKSATNGTYTIHCDEETDRQWAEYFGNRGDQIYDDQFCCQFAKDMGYDYSEII